MNLRKTLSALAVFAAAFSGAQLGTAPPAPGAVPSQFAGAPWPMRFHDPARTGQSEFLGAKLGEEIWRYRTSDSIYNLVTAKNGNVITNAAFNSNWWSEEVFVSSIDLTQDLDWRTKMIPYPWGFSQGVRGAPAIDLDGNVIVPSTNAQIVKLSPTGQILWIYQENNSTINETSPAVLKDRTIRHIQAQTLRALRPDGSVMWTLPGVGGGSGSVAVAPNGDMAAMNDRLGTDSHGHPIVGPVMWYVNSNGTLRWSFEAPHGGNGMTPVFGPDGSLYLTSSRLDPSNGNVIWADPNPVGGLTPGLTKSGRLITYGLAVRALDAQTGQPIWDAPLPGTPNEGVAIDLRENLFFTTTNGYLVSIDRNGATRFSVKVCDKFTSSPVIGTGGRVYAAGNTGFESFIFSFK